MHFCSIITADFIPYALALLDSIRKFRNDVVLHVLVTEKIEASEQLESEYSGLRIISHDVLCRDGIGKSIYEKYYGVYMDGFRWSLKPVLLQYLITHQNCDKVIYVDSDIHFYSDYSFLFDELNRCNVLLSPHWRSSDPYADEYHFFHLYIFGLYNGGFVAVNSGALPALNWWAKANHFICTIDACKGQYVDQTHLNLLPVYFDGVKSLKHRGCNVAEWNMVECKRVLKSNGEVLINDTEPIVFVHFSSSTIEGILNGKDPHLGPYLQIYFGKLELYGIDLEKQYREMSLKQDAHLSLNQSSKGRSMRARLKGIARGFFNLISR